jgi:hypothetical protein
MSWKIYHRLEWFSTTDEILRALQASKAEGNVVAIMAEPSGRGE